MRGRPSISRETLWTYTSFAYSLNSRSMKNALHELPAALTVETTGGLTTPVTAPRSSSLDIEELAPAADLPQAVLVARLQVGPPGPACFHPRQGDENGCRFAVETAKAAPGAARPAL